MELAKLVKQRGLDIVVFSGYTYEELLEMGEKDHWVTDLLSLTDLLVDGRFVEEERDLTLLFRGSRNQRVIDMNLTREQGKVTLAEKYI